MRSLTSAACVLFLWSAMVAAVPKWHELHSYTFEHFSAEFKRGYENEEYDMRRQLFETRLEEIKAHNAAGHSFKKGVNQFSDWTKAEFKAINKFRSFHRSRAAGKAARLDAESPPEIVPVYRPVPLDTTAPLPGQVDYRTWTNPNVLTNVKNQGHCGGCWGFSTVESIESMYALKFGELPILSVQQVLSCTDAMFGCGGGDYYYGWDYLKNGSDLNEEFVYSYTDFFANESKKDTAQCRNITKDWLPRWGWPAKARVTGYMGVAVNNAYAAMEALAHVGPMSVAVAASPWQDYDSGILINNNSDPELWSMDHAVQLVGYGYSAELEMNYWIVRNSWGSGWGEQGYIRLARPDVEPCGSFQDDDNTMVTVCGTSGVLLEVAYPLVDKVPVRHHKPHHNPTRRPTPSPM